MKVWKVLICLFTAVALATAVFGCSKAPEKNEAVTETKEQIVVNVVIDGSKGEDKALSLKGQIELSAGATAYDALVDLCDTNHLEITGDPSYVKTIGGLGEGSFGAAPCGWMYTINGNYPTDAADECVLNDGDELIWEFAK